MHDSGSCSTDAVTDSCSYSSDFVASIRAEFAVRGWLYDMVKRPNVEGLVVDVDCSHSDAIDEPLSDDDE